jgi:hypothetical protein
MVSKYKFKPQLLDVILFVIDHNKLINVIPVNFGGKEGMNASQHFLNISLPAAYLF